jgi:hypothetical protein
VPTVAMTIGRPVDGPDDMCGAGGRIRAAERVRVDGNRPTRAASATGASADNPPHVG